MTTGEVNNWNRKIALEIGYTLRGVEFFGYDKGPVDINFHEDWNRMLDIKHYIENEMEDQYSMNIGKGFCQISIEDGDVIAESWDMSHPGGKRLIMAVYRAVLDFFGVVGIEKRFAVKVKKTVYMSGTSVVVADSDEEARDIVNQHCEGVKYSEDDVFYNIELEDVEEI